MLIKVISALISTVQGVGLVRAAGVVQAAFSSEDKEYLTYKRRYEGTLTTCRRLSSMAPYGPYVNSIKKDNIIVAIIKEGIKISSNLSNKREVNNNNKK